jgi:ATP-dependent Clp protease ATP-binding subunit ClpC
MHNHVSRSVTPSESTDHSSIVHLESESLGTVSNDIVAVLRLQIESAMGYGGGGSSGKFDPNAPGALAKVNASKKSDTPLLDKFGSDYTKRAADGVTDPCIGRDKEIQSVIGTLLRRGKNNPIIIGEPGVGKTAIVEEIAYQIQAGLVPDLDGYRLIGLDMGTLLAGTKYRGEFEERLKGLLEEAKRAENVLLFIDEVHTIIGSGAPEGGLDSANMLKPALARGELQIIGATTIKEYRQHIEKDKALARRFQPTMLEPPTLEETIDILRGLKSRYEGHHKVLIGDKAVIAAARYSDRYLTDRFQPDKAIDLLDEAASRLALRRYKGGEARELTERDVAEVISGHTGFAVGALLMDDRERALGLNDALAARVIGQDHAIDALAKAEARRSAGVSADKRGYSYIFSGPTGVGKSLAAQVLAEQTGRKLIRFDMSEYMDSHTASKLIGAPPGFVGYGEGGQLTEAVRRNPQAIVLFDEFEKAHPDVWNMVLQVIEDGRLTDSLGKVVNFKDTLVIMTTNAGAKNPTKTGLGFASEDAVIPASSKSSEAVSHELVKHGFPPELLGRCTEVFEFNPLNAQALKEVVRQELKTLSQRVGELGFGIKFDDSCIAFLAEKGTDLQFGARPIRRAITKWIEDPLSEHILKSDFKRGDSINVAWEAGGEALLFSPNGVDSLKSSHDNKQG